VLLVAVVIALVLGAFRAGREYGDLGRIGAAAALGVAAYFLVHDSLDWMDEFPALAIPALAFPLAVAALAPRGRQGPPASERPSRGVGTRRQMPRPRSSLPRLRTAWRPVAFVGAGLLAAVALVPPYFASRYVERAYATYRAQPDAALRDLNRASGLNPFSIEPLVAKGTIAINLGESQTARLAFADALRREQNWYPWLQLALLDAQAGQFATASASLARAARLDVNDQLIEEARREITHHQLIDPARFNRLILSGPGGLFESDRIR
jgi:tetratricopeptide (TPR) repeat protein